MECLNGITDFTKTKEVLEAKSLIVKEYSDLGLYLVKYDKTKCDMNDPDVRMCRGIVLEKDVISLCSLQQLRLKLLYNLSSMDNVVY